MRNLALALSAVLAVLAAAPAGAAVRPAAGAYKGKLSSGTTVAFRVTKASRLTALRTGRMKVRCTTGARRTFWLERTPRSFKARRRGVYRVAARISNATRAGTMRFTAVFTRRTRARATIRFRFTSRASVCDTGTRRFTARRVAKPATTWRMFAGSTADGSILQIAMTGAGNALRPARMQAKLTCQDGGSVTLDIRNPIGDNVPAGATFRGAWKFTPPAIPGRPQPSGGGIELSGRVTATGIEGAARMSIGFVDGSWCDGGWTMFSIAGNTAAG